MLAYDIDDFRALDRRILDLVADGRTREGARLMVESYGSEIVGTCIGRLSDAALGEDAAQDAMVRAVTALPTYRGAAGLRPWLHRIAANRCIDLIRHRGTRHNRRIDGYEVERVAAPEGLTPREADEADGERRRQVAAVRQALACVKEPDRTWVELHYTQGVTYDDIAADSGLSRAAVKQRVWRAVKRVRAALADALQGNHGDLTQ